MFGYKRKKKLKKNAPASNSHRAKIYANWFWLGSGRSGSAGPEIKFFPDKVELSKNFLSDIPVSEAEPPTSERLSGQTLAGSSTFKVFS